MTPQFVDGWVVVPYDGADLASCYISFDEQDWRPAFKDYIDDQRVLKVRPSNLNEKVATVWVKVSGTIMKAGSVRVR